MNLHIHRRHIHKEENLKIVRDVMIEFSIKKFNYTIIEFNNVNLIYIKVFRQVLKYA